MCEYISNTPNLFALASIHSLECAYHTELGLCTCGVIPIPSIMDNDEDNYNIHDYSMSSISKCVFTMVDVLMDGEKIDEIPKIFMDCKAKSMVRELQKALTTGVGDGCKYMDVMVYGYIYLMRVKEYITPETFGRFAQMAMYMALKYHIDDYEGSIYFDFMANARATYREFMRMEITFLHLIDYNLNVSPYEFYTFRDTYLPTNP